MVAPTYRVSDDRNKITFAVDSVKHGAARFPSVSLWTRVEKMTERSLRVTSHPSHFRVVEDDGCHALLSAVHLAFSRHLPLALTPDVIWLTIAQGFAQHANNHQEDLRPLLMRHEGKMLLRAEVKQVTRQEDWADAANQWTQQIASHIAPDLHDTLLCDFSTTTPVIRIASQVVMMEAFQHYFDYAVRCICGIPTITLYGTVGDWRTIRERVERLAPYRLSWWTDRLLPLCDAFIATAEGRPPIQFWQQIYKPKEAYGGDTITGWIADLFPYLLNREERPDVVNPLLCIPRSQLTAEDGLPLRLFPNGLSSVPVSLELGESASAAIPLEFLGGFFGVTQDPLTGCVQAEVGWGVQERSALTDILEKLAREHTLNPPRYAPGFERLVLEWVSIPVEFVEMMCHCDGGKLFAETDHPWRLLRSSSFTLHNDRGASYVRFADLADGRSIGFTWVSFWRTGDRPRLLKRECWIVLGRLEPDPVNASQQVMPKANSVVIATGLPQFFERVLQAEGQYYFDSPDFIPDGHWAQRDEDQSRGDDAAGEEVISEKAVPSVTGTPSHTVPKRLVLIALLLVLALVFGVYHR